MKRSKRRLKHMVIGLNYPPPPTQYANTVKNTVYFVKFEQRMTKKGLIVVKWIALCMKLSKYA